MPSWPIRKTGNLAELAMLVDRLREEVRRCLNFIPEIQKTMTLAEEALHAHATS